MKTKILLIFLIALYPSLALSAKIAKTKPLQWDKTPLYEYFKFEEYRFLNAYPYLYLEEESDSLDYENLLKLGRLLTERDLEVCLERNPALTEFCKFYLSVSLMGVESPDFEGFMEKEGVLAELAKLGQSMFHAVSGDTGKARDINLTLKNDAVKIYFRKYMNILETPQISGKTGDVAYDYAVMFTAGRNRTETLESLLKYDDKRGHISFLIGGILFEKGNYGGAAEFYLKAAKNDAINSIAIENAVYSYFNAGDFKKSREHSENLSKAVRETVDTMIKLEKMQISKLPERFPDDEDSKTYLLNFVKESVQKGVNIGFLNGIERRDLDEEMLFYICSAKLVYGGWKSYDPYCKNLEWKNSGYKIFWSGIENIGKTGGIPQNPEKISSVISAARLYNYHPFGYFYAALSYQSGDYGNAILFYERLLKHPQKLRREKLENIYFNLADIYKRRGSYYTALKFLEDGLDGSSPENEEIFHMEIVRTLFEKEDWEEVLWRAERLLEQGKNSAFKKELQLFLEICYERLGKTKAR